MKWQLFSLLQRMGKFQKHMSQFIINVIRHYNKLVRWIQMNHGYLTWIYPLYYPYGNQGWCNNLRRIDSNKQISRAAYVKSNSYM